MRHRLPVAISLLLSILSVPSFSQTCGTHCGTERWKVKTLTDTTVINIDLDPVEKSINWLRTRSSLPPAKQLIGIETMVFKIKGVVLSFKKEENDNDFHVVIAQSNNHNRTMIIEFPDPQCANVCSSGFLDQIRKAREDFIVRFGEPTGRFKELDDPILVEVVGVGFFDRMHGQRGRALPSGVELHPVIIFKALE